MFQRTQKGFGFVRLRSEDATAELKDIYIPAESTQDAATGDVVLVQVGRPRRGQPGPRGEIVEVVERQTQQFVGTYLESAGAAYVRIDGPLFARPIYVGDPGAKNARPDDKVVIEMLRFPSPLRDGEGVITEVLGPRGKPGVDTLSIIREFNLPDQFPPDVLEDAHAQAEKFDESPGGRTDFTGETIVTIDPVDARDFDDAISLERLEDGGWRLGVHIADVSHFVRPGSPLDREATDRATSVYLPDRVLPMLPEVISNGLASLQPGKVRFTKSAVMEFTAEGLRTSTELHSAAIRSSKRLTYEQVDEFLAGLSCTGSRPTVCHCFAEQRPPRRGTACRHACHSDMRRKLGGKVCDLLGRMHTLAMTLRKRRIDPRRARTDHARGQGGTGPAGAGGRGARGRKHREPPDHRGVHAGRERGGGRDAPRPRLALPAPRPPTAQPAETQGPDRVHRRVGLQDGQPAKAASPCKSSWTPPPAGPSSTPSISPCSARCNGRSTAPRRKATTPWPASAIATSPRPYAAIPT